MKLQRLVFLLLTICSAVTTTVSAQTPALSVRVVDEQGGAIPGADVRLGRDDGAVVRRGVTDREGRIRYDTLPAGKFVAQVDVAGFRRHVASVTVAADREAVLNITLAIAGVDETVVVTAAGLPQTPQETSKAISSIDSRDITARNATVLADIVRFTPGVQIRENGGPGQLVSLRIRGLRPDATAVLVDGMRLRDPSSAQGDFSSFLSNINFMAADRVEVLRGSGSSLYGTNAVGGVVNIVSSQGGGRLGGDVQLEGGSLGFERSRGSLTGGAFDERLAFSVGAVQWNIADGRDGHDAARSLSGQGLVRYEIDGRTSLMARVLTSRDRADANQSPTASGIPIVNVPANGVIDAIPVAAEEIARADRGQPFTIGSATYFPGRNDPDSTRDSWFNSTAVQLRHASSAKLSWQASYQRVHTSRTYQNGPLGPGFQSAAVYVSEFLGDIDTLDARVTASPGGSVSLSAGYEFEREIYGDHQDDNLPGPARVNTRMRIAQRAHAMSGAAQFGWLDQRLQVSLSGRVQSFDLSKPTFSVGGSLSPYENVAIAAPPRAITGDVSVAYLVPSSGTKVRSHIGNAYRSPALYERFGGGFYSDFFTGSLAFSAYGDPRLEPDRYRSVDAGIDQPFLQGRVRLSASLFYVKVLTITAFDLGSKIEFGKDPFGRSIGYINGSGGYSRGVEVGVEARPVSTMRLAIGFTHTHAETETDITIPGFLRLPAVYADTFTAVATNDWTGRLQTTFDLFYGSSSYHPFTVGSFPNSVTRAYRFPGFTRAALTAAYKLRSSATSGLRAYVKVDNLLDSTYFVGGWQALGRTAVAGLTLGF